MSYDLDALAARDQELAGRPMPTPAYSTARTPGLASRAGQIGKVAALLGKPLIPWQAHGVDIATQINPPGSQLYWRYPLVVWVLPRQVGKTTVVRPMIADRLINRPGTDCRMTAQLGKYASERWEELASELEHSALAPFVRKWAGKGSERLEIGGSAVRPFAPGPKSLHSTSPNLVLVDEVWAFDAAAGSALTTAIRPAQITRRDRQLWLISAQGDENSDWLEALIAAGRASVNDPASLMCYLEFAPAEGADPYDPATWEYHPGLGHLITLTDLAAEADPANNTHAEFLRSFLNLSVRGVSSLIDLDKFDDLADPDPAPAPASCGVGFDVAIDRTAASVWAAWIDQAGHSVYRVLDTRPGADWLPDYLADLHTASGVVCSVVDGGSTSPVIEALTRRNIPTATLTPREIAGAWALFKSQNQDGHHHHDGSPALRSALTVVAEGGLGDYIAPKRRRSVGPIDPLLAALAARHAAGAAPTGLQIFHL